MKKHLSIHGFMAAILAVITFVGLEHEPEGIRLVSIARDAQAIVMLTIGTLIAMAFAFAMPRLKTGSMGKLWRFPSSTYLMPRWIMWLCMSTILGQLIGLLTFAAVQEPRLLWLSASLTCILGAFCLGGWPRLGRSAGTEFTMPWWRLP
jgi:hypothetical protein